MKNIQFFLVVLLTIFAACLGCDSSSKIDETTKLVGNLMNAVKAGKQVQGDAEKQAAAQAAAIEAQMRAEFAKGADGKAPAPGAVSPAASPAAGSAPSGDSIGVPECDEYIEKYSSCLKAKVPEMARGPMLQGFEQTRLAWKASATSPEAKATLAQTCKMAMDMAKQAMKIYGCEL